MIVIYRRLGRTDSRPQVTPMAMRFGISYHLIYSFETERRKQIKITFIKSCASLNNKNNNKKQNRSPLIY